MRIYFERVNDPESAACNSNCALWHLQHGWYYNVWDCSDDGKSGRIIGVFYVTQLAGLGGILHFETVARDIPAAHVFAAFRKAIRIVKPHLDGIFATIPVHKKKLIRVMERIGFTKISLAAPLRSGGMEFILLQYFPRPETIV